ncbi:NAD(P)H-binding protein (plasmid) [Agrobacterium sp. MA01]|nr:NAD(P)H-binding protein [Agrobacterium sp. MA01]
MILLTTPTGDIGRRVLSRLLTAGASVRVIARNASKLPLNPALDVVEGSMADADTIARALPSVTRVFWLPPGDATLPSPEAAYGGVSKAFCDAVPGSRVTHIVGISALGRGWPKPAGHVTATLAVDDMIANTGAHYRALACASLMDNIGRQAEPIRTIGQFFQPTPANLKLPHVAKADVAQVAADLLLDPEWTGVETIPLLGPEDLSFDQMAAIMSEVLGREIVASELSMAHFGQMMRELGASDGMAQAYVEMLTAKNEGMDHLVTSASRRDTPTTFRTWCACELLPLVRGVTATDDLGACSLSPRSSKPFEPSSNSAKCNDLPHMPYPQYMRIC